MNFSYDVIKAAEARFHTKYEIDEETGCHLWKASLQTSGYPQFFVGGEGKMGHQYSWCLANPHQTIESPYQIAHSCDTPRCVNSAHLSKVTPKQNSQDRSAKGRSKNKREFTYDQVLEMRTRSAAGETRTALMEEFSIALKSLTNLLRGVTYKDVPIVEGSKHPKSVGAPVKLSDQDVLDIRQLGDREVDPNVIATQYGITRAYVVKIINFQARANVQSPN